jgi:hypothetical protein
VEKPVDDALSLEQIEDDFWGDPPADATRLIRTVHQLRSKPIGTLDAEDLRMLVAQKEGLTVLVPRVLTLLEEEPLLEGDFYPGDVLVATMRVPPDYWAANPAQLARAERVVASIENPEVDLTSDIEAFRRNVRSVTPEA